MLYEVKAINPKHQRAVNLYLKYDDLRDQAEQMACNEETSKECGKLERAAERHYETAYEYWDTLPKREKLNIDRIVFLYAAGIK